jgi:hypothetical protein
MKKAVGTACGAGISTSPVAACAFRLPVFLSASRLPPSALMS